MASAEIEINGVAGSEEDLELGVEVTLTNVDDTGVTDWLWELLDIPTGSIAVLADETTDTATFTPDVEGSYLIKLTVNTNEDTDTAIAAVKTLRNRIRIPAAGERTETSATRGWAEARNAAIARLAKLIN